MYNITVIWCHIDIMWYYRYYMITGSCRKPRRIVIRWPGFPSVPGHVDALAFALPFWKPRLLWPRYSPNTGYTTTQIYYLHCQLLSVCLFLLQYCHYSIRWVDHFPTRNRSVPMHHLLLNLTFQLLNTGWFPVNERKKRWRSECPLLRSTLRKMASG